MGGGNLADRLTELILAKLNGKTSVDGYNIDELLKMCLFMQAPAINNKENPHINMGNRVYFDRKTNSVVIGDRSYTADDGASIRTRIAELPIKRDSSMLSHFLSEYSALTKVRN